MTGQPRERFFLLRGGKIYRGSAHVCHTRFRELFCRTIHSFIHRSASMEPESPTRNTYETCFLLSSRTRCRDEKKEGEKKKKNRNLFRLSRAEKHLSIDRFLNPTQRLFSVKNSKRNGLSETRGEGGVSEKRKFRSRTFKISEERILPRGKGMIISNR